MPGPGITRPAGARRAGPQLCCAARRRTPLNGTGRTQSYRLPLARHRNRQHTAPGLTQGSYLGGLPRWGPAGPGRSASGPMMYVPSHPCPARECSGDEREIPAPASPPGWRGGSARIRRLRARLGGGRGRPLLLLPGQAGRARHHAADPDPALDNGPAAVRSPLPRLPQFAGRSPRRCARYPWDTQRYRGLDRTRPAHLADLGLTGQLTSAPQNSQTCPSRHSAR